tara:strand:+ start:343 stop:2772 length:2430 start_codon:yes stop_codon:yes gene_type:complete
MALFTGHTITPDSALGGTQIQRSLRFAGAAFNSISRTPSSTGNQKVWTWSCWFKRTKLGDGSYNYLLSSYGNNDGIAAIYFDSDDRINTYYDTSGANPYGAVNNRRYRDTTSWMHIVWQVDAINTTQKIWINGVEETLSSSYNPPNFAYTMNQSGQLQTIGGAAWYPDGTGNNNYLTEIHFSDGNKYTPSDFGYTDAQTGQWRPKNGNVIKSNITYGTNGYWLDFRDNTSTTTLGYDYSGNGNHWTLNNMSVAAGSDNDSVTDTPTNNFVTLNPLYQLDDNCVLSDGNLKATGSSESFPGAAANIELTSGKWYYEFKITTKTSNPICGVCQNNYLSGGTGRIMYRADGVYIMSNSSEPTDPDTFGVGDIIGVAIDLDHGDGLIRFYKNGTLQTVNSGLNNVKSNLSISTLGGLLPYIQMYTGDACTVNFGQQPFVHTPPTGHRALNSKNRATPSPASMVRPQRHFDVLLWDGDGSASRDVTGLEFKPDMIWIKNRSQANTHSLQDSIIGFGDDKTLRPDTSNALDTNGNLYGYINHTLPNGFNVNGGSEHVSSRVNSSSSGAKHVAWCWKGGGTAVSNTDGSITTQVSANPTAGFSIVKWTGNQTSGATIGHGLGATPQAGFFKRYDGTGNWIFPFFDNQVAGKLNNNDAFTNSYYNTFFPSQPNSTTVTIGSNDDINRNTSTYAAYIFTSVEGYSKIGSYTGVGGSGNGNFVHTGFRPAFLIVTNAASEFTLLVDSKRGAYNPIDERLFPGWNYAESDEVVVDFLSNGFKARNDGGANIISGDGSTYLYIAFAERPSGTMFGLDANAR